MIQLYQILWQKCIELIKLSGGQYSTNKNIRFKTPKLSSDLCAYSDAYIAVKGRINVTDTNHAYRRNKKLTFKNNDPFRLCKSKINNIYEQYGRPS